MHHARMWIGGCASFFFFGGGYIWSCAYIFQVKEEFICSYAIDNFSNMRGE